MQNRTKGIITGVSSYILWGVLGLYWSLLKEVTALDILGYRFIFSLVFMAVILSFQKQWTSFFVSVKTLWQSGKIIWVILSSLFIALNWGTYIYMVGHGQATEASLGYYIMPLLNVVVAVFFFPGTTNKDKRSGCFVCDNWRGIINDSDRFDSFQYDDCGICLLFLRCSKKTNCTTS